MRNVRAVGYVSDELYRALDGVSVEFERDGQSVGVTRSSPTGAIYLDVPEGDYTVTLAKDGYGAKRVLAVISSERPMQFRLLSDKLYGYAWPKWTRSGDVCEFRVHAAEAYYVTLWRYGASKEFVRALGWFDEHSARPNLQVLPDSDFTQSGVFWNRFGFAKNWQERCPAGHGPEEATGCTVCRSGSYLVTAPARSGLYFFHVETPSGTFLSFPWVVAPAKPTARIAVIASTNTWNAYNNFGGRSNYLNPAGLPARPTVNSRLELDRYAGLLTGVWRVPNDGYRPLSFDRPEPYNAIPQAARLESPIRGRQAGHLVEAEWKLLGWLERQGHLYDFWSDAQLDDGSIDLGAYDVLMISTHPEYWTAGAFRRVHDWVEHQGGRLMYLGGNGIDCEVEYLSGDTMRCKSYLPWAPGTMQFTDPATGVAYDCRFHYTTGSSPAELLGVVYTEPGVGTSAPFRVEDAAHWALAGTGLRNGDTFGTQSLHERCPHGASGHETDKRSPRSPADVALLATGLNGPDAGAELVCREPKNGGAVFSASSITWPSCLLVDETVSKITANVLARYLRGAAAE